MWRLVPHHFLVQVADEQGLTSNKSVKVTVSPDPDKLNIVEVVLNKNLSHFTQNQVSVGRLILQFYNDIASMFFIY